MKKLSIIIPVYNVEAYLAKCLDSVIYEDISDYEIIVVNDGSTDSSPAIAAEYAVKYPGLIKLINKPNGGLGSARNAGIRASEGEYIIFLDSDDTLAKDAVREIFETFKQDYDIAVFDFIFVDENGNGINVKKGSEREGCFSLAEYPELLFCPPNACNKIWKKSLFTGNNIFYPDRLWFEDLATVPLLYLEAKSIIYVPKIWYRYLIRSGSITNSKKTARNLEMLQVCDRVFDYYREKGVFEKYKSQLEYMTVYNELITSTTRVNLIDRKSYVQDELLDYFIRNFPDYRCNKYIKAMPGKLKLLLSLISRKNYLAVNLIMRLNKFLRK